ncbi:flippase [Candidatus Vampirococcus lugosii]|uniref:flippase n=1 Tax=Candidatus Vampirococcus lugosii TaxID=2789015 RepID=UPI001BCE9925|nr:flippase [Candidatus Vampirococcus lugosii]
MKKLKKEIVWSFLTKIVTFGLFFGLNIFLARKLGPETFGLWSFFLSFITIFWTISFFGINASTKKFIAQHNGTGEIKNIIKNGLNLRLIFSLGFALLFLILYFPLINLFNKPELSNLWLLGTLLIFFAGITEFTKSIFMGLHRIKYNFIVNFIEHGLKFILVVIFLLFSESLLNITGSFLVALIVSSIVGFAITYFVFYKNLGESKNTYYKEIFNYSLPLLFISLGFLVFTEIDVLMLGILSSSEEVGVYAIAKQIIIKLPHITMAIAMGVMPIFAKYNQENKQELKKLFIKTIKINNLIFLPILLGIFFLSPFLVPIIFGQEYIGSIVILQILSIYLFFMINTLLLGNFLDYNGKANKRAIFVGIGIIVNISLNLYLIPNYGAIGASIGTTFSYLPYFLLNAWEVRKSLK